MEEKSCARRSSGEVARQREGGWTSGKEGIWACQNNNLLTIFPKRALLVGAGDDEVGVHGKCSPPRILLRAAIAHEANKAYEHELRHRVVLDFCCQPCLRRRRWVLGRRRGLRGLRFWQRGRRCCQGAGEVWARREGGHAHSPGKRSAGDHGKNGLPVEGAFGDDGGECVGGRRRERNSDGIARRQRSARLSEATRDRRGVTHAFAFNTRTNAARASTAFHHLSLRPAQPASRPARRALLLPSV